MACSHARSAGPCAGAAIRQVPSTRSADLPSMFIHSPAHAKALSCRELCARLAVPVVSITRMRAPGSAMLVIYAAYALLVLAALACYAALGWRLLGTRAPSQRLDAAIPRILSPGRARPSDRPLLP